MKLLNIFKRRSAPAPESERHDEPEHGSPREATARAASIGTVAGSQAGIATEQGAGAGADDLTSLESPEDPAP
jgi:hypothetical protein